MIGHMMMGGGDPFWSNVSLLLLADYGYVDLSSQNFTVTTAGNISISSTSPIIGNSSYQTDRVSTQDGLRIVHSANNALNFGTGDFTIELYVNRTEANSGGVSNTRYFITNYSSSSINAGNFAFSCSTGSGLASVLYLGATGSNVLAVTNGSPTVNTWTHMALVRQSGVYRMYRNGLQIGTTSTGGTANLTSSETTLMYSPYFTGNNFQGLENAIRITKGVCRYPNGTTFTPPTNFI
jgi:hypothetical protein